MNLTHETKNLKFENLKPVQEMLGDLQQTSMLHMLDTEIIHCTHCTELTAGPLEPV